MTMVEECRANKRDGWATDHAIVRWLERIDGYDIAEIRDLLRKGGNDDPGDTAVLQHLHDKYGITRSIVVQRMITPQVKSAIRAGTTQINRGHYSLVVQDSNVVTIVMRRCPQGRVERARRLRGKARNARP